MAKIIPLLFAIFLHAQTLENGLKYHFEKPLQHSYFIFIQMKIGFGSVYENKSEQGLAHFLEHISFNSTNSKNKDEILKILQEKGVKPGLNLNATTDFDNTTFRMQILNTDENFDLTLKFFSEILLNLALLQSEIDKEKGIIINEANQIKSELYELFKSRLKIYYLDSLYSKRLPIGDLNVIKNANSKQLRELYEKFYHPCNSEILILGNLDENLVHEKINAYFSNPKTPCKFPKIKVPFYDKKVSFVNPLVDDFYFYFEAKNDTNGFENSIKQNLLSKVIDEIYAKNGICKINFEAINVQNQKILYAFSSSKLDNLISVIKSLKSDDLKSYFLSAKKELMGEIFTNYSKFPNPLNQMQKLSQSLANNTPILSHKDEFNQILTILNNLKFSDFSDFIDEILSSKGVIFESKIEIKELENLIKNTKPLILNNKTLKNLKFNIAPKNDNISYKFNEKLKIFEINANGKKLFFKPIKGDKIYISAIKKIKNNDTSNLKVAVDISNLSGVGKYDKKTLDSFFKSNFIAIKNLGDVSISYNISSSKQFLKEAFEILHSGISEPKIEKEIYENYIKDDEISPKLNFELKLNELYYGEESSKISNYESLQNLLKDEFSTKFDFFIMGDIEFEMLLELTGKYIANLNLADENGSFSDDTAPFKGEFLFMDKNNPFIRDEVYILLNSQNYIYNDKNKEILKAGTTIMQMILKEILREKSAKIYDINFNSLLTQTNSFGVISFICENKNGKNLAKEIREILTFYAKNGKIKESYLQNYKKTEILRVSNLYKNDEFMLNLIINHYFYGENLLSLDERIKLINSINLDDIEKAIGTNFANDNFFVAIFTHN